tara:strand:- start:14458 stop:16545 length:2088 start_codon:yes stop_codon:yes gene_type:complete
MAEDTPESTAASTTEVEIEVPGGPDLTKVASEVNRKFEEWRADRRPHELQWFINAAFIRGQQTDENEPLWRRVRSIDELEEPINKHRASINRAGAKVKTRFAKFAKSRPRPLIIPFTNERKDRLDAKATQRSLEYLWEKGNLETKYVDALLWAAKCGKSFWWFHWDNAKMVPVRLDDESSPTGFSVEDAQLGDIEVEVGNAFEVLASDNRISRLADQPEIMRAKVRDLEDVKARYPEHADDIKGDAAQSQFFEFERQIASLSSRPLGGISALAASAGQGSNNEPDKVLVKEHFMRPTGKYPNGRYVVVAGEIVVKYEEELPYSFHDMPNPYPVIEFTDVLDVGQFWTSTFVEQLIPIQRAYNDLRSHLQEQVDMNIHPKWMVPKQAQIPDEALVNAAGEVVEWNYIPGMPEPHPVTPGNIASDAWRMADLLKGEFDDVSQIFPSFEGKTGQAKSGFQTNLLQEASDNVHAPDGRGYELAIQDAALKFRRMMKVGYTVERLLSFAGPNSIPEMYQFSNSQVDEHAAIRVQVGSAMAGLKSTKIEQTLNLYDRGLLGDPMDPEVKRRTLTSLDMNGMEEAMERAALDQEMAQHENNEILEGRQIAIPQFYENHLVHYETHTEELKGPAAQQLTDEVRLALITHIILHMKFLNPVGAFELAQEYRLFHLIESGMIPPAEPPPPPGPQGQGPPPPPGPA